MHCLLTGILKSYYYFFLWYVTKLWQAFLCPAECQFNVHSLKHYCRLLNKHTIHDICLHIESFSKFELSDTVSDCTSFFISDLTCSASVTHARKIYIRRSPICTLTVSFSKFNSIVCLLLFQFIHFVSFSHIPFLSEIYALSIFPIFDSLSLLHVKHFCGVICLISFFSGHSYDVSLMSHLLIWCHTLVVLLPVTFPSRRLSPPRQHVARFFQKNSPTVCVLITWLW